MANPQPIPKVGVCRPRNTIGREPERGPHEGQGAGNGETRVQPLSPPGQAGERERVQGDRGAGCTTHTREHTPHKGAGRRGQGEKGWGRDNDPGAGGWGGESPPASPISPLGKRPGAPCPGLVRRGTPQVGHPGAFAPCPRKPLIPLPKGQGLAWAWGGQGKGEAPTPNQGEPPDEGTKEEVLSRAPGAA